MNTQKHLARLASRLVSGNEFPEPPKEHAADFDWMDLYTELRRIPGFSGSERCNGSDWEGVWFALLDQGSHRALILAMDCCIVIFRVEEKDGLTSVLVGEPQWPETMNEVRDALAPIVVREVQRRYERVLVTA
jgi:hypothetical protein